MALPREQHRPLTYGDYLGWEGRWEVVQGEPYDMSPAPSRKHQILQVSLSTQIDTWLEGKSCQVYPAPFDIILAEPGQEAEDAETVLQPDLSVVCDSSKVDDRGCFGAPDWVIEVLSPSTAARDHLQKRELYERHGVVEYWLVHPNDRILTRYLRGENGKFEPAQISALLGRTAVAALPGLEIDWDRIVARLPD